MILIQKSINIERTGYIIKERDEGALVWGNAFREIDTGYWMKNAGYTI